MAVVDLVLDHLGADVRISRFRSSLYPGLAATTAMELLDCRGSTTLNCQLVLPKMRAREGCAI